LFRRRARFSKMVKGGRRKHAAINTKGKSSDHSLRVVGNAKKAQNMRSKNTIDRLKMYRGGKAVRNTKGVVIGGSLQTGNTAGGTPVDKTTTVSRIAPNRRWFGNTRLIGQNELDKFREQFSAQAADPFNVVLRSRKLPLALLQDSKKTTRMNLLSTESFESVYGSKKTRKRPKLAEYDLESLVAKATEKSEQYNEGIASGKVDSNVEANVEYKDLVRHKLFDKGQSRRIWGELYKVIDSSDVVIQVLDARNVPGTRSKQIENYLRKNAGHKHLIFVLNKCDLVPNWVTKRWVKFLGKTTPTLAFHASLSTPFGKGALISLLRQFAKLHSDKKQISVGIIGYPNVGKSSVINTLVKKKSCKVAPIPGETKIWQYITLMKRIYLIDCPGVVYDTGDSETEIVLKGVVRAERLPDPTEHVAAILERVKPDYLRNQYHVAEWTDEEDFMRQIANRTGKLLKGGEPDYNGVAVCIINDWQRGKLPFFVPPPTAEGTIQPEGETSAASAPALELDDIDMDVKDMQAFPDGFSKEFESIQQSTTDTKFDSDGEGDEDGGEVEDGDVDMAEGEDGAGDEEGSDGEGDEEGSDGEGEGMNWDDLVEQETETKPKPASKKTKNAKVVEPEAVETKQATKRAKRAKTVEPETETKPKPAAKNAKKSKTAKAEAVASPATRKSKRVKK
jgi:nuclear GTP-binding protein